jgi:sec-independent protein translocase protein TatB
MGAPPPVQLSTIGMWDSMFLMLLALVVFGPRRLPQIGRQIGKLMYEFRKASNDFKFQMEEELRLSEDADRRKKEEEERARNLALNPPAPASPIQIQTIEAQASIGAVEQASVSAQLPWVRPTSTDPGEGTDIPVTAESPTAEPENRIYPRISPPSTGEPVPASRYGANGQADAAADASVAAEANIGAEPAPSAPEPAAGSDSEPTRTETVNQHG